jgi:hypothetical protein
LRLIDHDAFVDLVSSVSLKSRTYERTVDAFEAVDQLEEIRDTGDRVLMLARSDRLRRAQAESLLHELLVCFAEPLAHRRKLDEVKRIVRRCNK